MKFTIYHNPACGTSRNVLAHLQTAGVDLTVVEYLKTPPDRTTIETLIARSGMTARAFLREKGTPYAELGLGDESISENILIDHMLKHPILINRPIVATDTVVRLCRPSETVLSLIKESV
jgi:arsenate reductase